MLLTDTLSHTHTHTQHSGHVCIICVPKLLSISEKVKEMGEIRQKEGRKEYIEENPIILVSILSSCHSLALCLLVNTEQCI